MSTAGAALGSVPEISDREYRLFRDLVLQASGIHLNPTKKPLLYSRLVRRVRDLGLGSFEAYYRCVVEDPEGLELATMIDRVTTNETHFFREPHHFEHLEHEIIPAWLAAARAGERARHVRVWSAGCSTGEEPYSLAMALLSCLPPETGWTIDILATDLSTRVLDAARSATWPIAKADEIPRPFLKRFMLQGIGASTGKLRAGPEIREIIRFAWHNLNDSAHPAGGPFDLVFCRNVLIYFDAAHRDRVVERLAALLAPGGRLFLGHAESVRSMAGRLRPAGATVYALADAGEPGIGRRTP